eukprot:5901625-Pyramimonas_sp.AAC.1
MLRKREEKAPNRRWVRPRLDARLSNHQPATSIGAGGWRAQPATSTGAGGRRVKAPAETRGCHAPHRGWWVGDNETATAGASDAL